MIVTQDFLTFLRTSVRRSSKGFQHETTLVQRLDNGVYSLAVIHREKNEHAEYGYLETRYTITGDSRHENGKIENYETPRREWFTRYVASSWRGSAPITLSSLLKVGDTVRVRFLIGNNTQTLNNAGLCHDSAYIDVYRGNRLIGSVYVADVIAPVGSSARFAY